MSHLNARALSWACRLLMFLAILLLIGHLAIYVHYSIGLMRFPFDYDQGEGFELVDTILFSQGEWPYRDNEVYPFYASNYPPLFHVILVPFVWVFGEAYWYGRLIGFLGTLVTAWAIGYVVYREERHRAAAILAGLSFLASNYVYHVGPLFRQHMLMVMFETLAVAVLAHVLDTVDRRQRRRTMIIGLVLLLAAGFTKQLALATSIAVFGFLFLRSPRRSVAWGMIFAATAGGLFLWINVATHGEWWENIIAANVNTFFPQQFVNLFRQWFRLHWALIVLAGLFAAYELYFTRLSLYSVWWVLAIANAVLAGKWGAGDSYFATAIAATCLLAGLFAARSLRGAWTFPDIPLTRPFRRWRAQLAARSRSIVAAAGIMIPLLYLGYALTVIKMPTEGRFFGGLSDVLGLESSYWDRYAFYDAAGWTEGYATIGHIPTETDVNNGWRIVDILRESDRPAMSEEAGFSLRAGKDVITNPTQLKNLYENALYDPTTLIQAIRAHDFSVVIFRAQFYPPPVLDAVYEAYYPADVIPMNGFNYEIWRPGPPQDERQNLAIHLESIAPGEARTQALTLSVERAAEWLSHALAYHNWTPQEGAALSADPNRCFSGQYRQSERVVHIDLCSAGAGSELILAGNDD